MATVTLHNLVKAYGKAEVLHGINLEVADGEFVVFVGPSGCGKSTTLRMIAGLEDVTGGEVQIDGRTVNHLEPKDRDIAMVFQNYAIYPHMSVRKNIGFGLRTSKLSKPEREKRIEEVAAMLSMTDYLDRKPAQLSGGQRQRVAIGRAMVRDPAVFLFDEPLSNLDAQLRSQMRLEIKKLHQRVGTTIIFVTHDQVEAMTMADRIVIMKDGHIQQIGTPAEVFHQPANIFVAQFIGAPSMNLMPGRAVSGGVEVGGTVIARETDHSGELTIGIRPDDLHVTEGEGRFAGRITLLEPLGSETLAYVDIGGQEVVARADGRNPPALGSMVQLAVDPENLHLFGADGVAIK
ncbi:sn-glycerol-3-phosphate ABC transporter ATP-binding protein UgpC (plasmid) [Pseudorhodobacter turbinis]|uniref:sn-glycerol-3-phosphate ABC transporter ATP-binding protein UgpC n=1 Tax=Pseudorhodobacter turbinis TaxID=2500533 RepID=A0A4P8EJ40_9RHOB|nr:sn-glycerol-3-phosphate ABC transporter ATP-binding protein UgpC [Pseudorhodobacter turbinis]QCO57026.1 sn-glycerol-3-phosphate ABC transporter ATP-binding protein UgpC [Pseudorhodobacter turbinis]